MRRIEFLTVGWSTSRIREVVAQGLLSRFHSALITSIDSGVEIHSTSTGRRMVADYENCRFLGGGVVVPAKSLPEIDTELNLFNGFDELWCFDRAPTKALPLGLSIVSTMNLETDETPDNLGSWMVQSGCVLGLGDGIGLNFATSDESLARQISLVQ